MMILRSSFYFMCASALICNISFANTDETSNGGGAMVNPSVSQISAPPRTVTKTIVETPNKSNSAVVPQGVILPYGYNLFTMASPQSNPTGISPHYVIAAGDRVNVNIWGAVSSASIITVDPQGNIFIPEVGPVAVAGVQARNLNHVIQSEIRKVYQNNVEVYVNLEDRVPVSIFVSGAVRAPGRYAGNPGDSLIDYLAKAGGVDLVRGSFRKIDILRHNQIVETYDLYEFLKNGNLPQTSLQEGDVLVVSEIGKKVTVTGATDHAFSFELPQHPVTGHDIIHYAAMPKNDVTHVIISGTRDKKPFNSYVTLAEFEKTPIHDGDDIFFEQGAHEDTIKVHISGIHLGAKTMVLPIDARLQEVLANIQVRPKISRTDAIYLKRKSVAIQQKKSLEDSIKRLQETLLLARASGNSQSTPVGEGELKLLDQFIAKTESLNPEGRVVIMGSEKLADMSLEAGDEIVIPAHSDLVTITGEVHLPKAIVWSEGDDVIDYISRSGGFTDNANEDDIIVIRANGETELGRSVRIMPGDEVIIMPEVKINNLDLASSVADILYKAVLAVAIPIQLGDN